MPRMRFHSVTELVKFERRNRRRIPANIYEFDYVPEIKYIEIAPNIFVPDAKPGPSSRQDLIPNDKPIKEHVFAKPKPVSNQTSSSVRQDLRKKILEKGISNRVNIIENMANTILNEDMSINDVDSLKLLPFKLNDLISGSKEKDTVITEMEQAKDNKIQSEKLLNISGNGYSIEESNIESIKDNFPNKDMSMNENDSPHLLKTSLNISVSKEKDTAITKKVELVKVDAAQSEKLLSIIGDGISTQESYIDSIKVPESKVKDIIAEEIESDKEKDEKQRKRILSIFGDGIIPPEECDIKTTRDQFPKEDKRTNENGLQHLLPSSLSVSESEVKDIMIAEEIKESDKEKEEKQRKRILSIFGDGVIPPEECDIKTTRDKFPKEDKRTNENGLQHLLPSSSSVSVFKEEDTQFNQETMQAYDDEAEYENQHTFGYSTPTERYFPEYSQDEFPNKNMFSVFKSKESVIIRRLNAMDNDRNLVNLKRNMFEDDIFSEDYESTYDAYPFKKRVCQDDSPPRYIPSTLNVSVSENTGLMKEIKQSDSDEEYESLLSVFGSDGIYTP